MTRRAIYGIKASLRRMDMNSAKQRFALALGLVEEGGGLDATVSDKEDDDDRPISLMDESQTQSEFDDLDGTDVDVADRIPRHVETLLGPHG